MIENRIDFFFFFGFGSIPSLANIQPSPDPPVSSEEVYSEEDDSNLLSAHSNSTLVLENPDGSFHHALPTGLRYKKPRCETPPLDVRQRGLGLNDWIIWDPAILEQIERLYRKHERVFVILLFFQFLLEMGFNALLVRHQSETQVEIHRAYHFLSDDEGAKILFWVIISAGFAFAAVYYTSAVLAVWDRRASYMKLFSDVAIVGVLGQVMYAYINRFNLVIFFLRFIIFAHSRFLHAILNGTARIVIASGPNAAEPILIDV